jgi:hypothetical protein
VVGEVEVLVMAEEEEVFPIVEVMVQEVMDTSPIGAAVTLIGMIRFLRLLVQS